MDAVFDTVGGDTLRRSRGILRSGGRLVTIAAPEEGSRDERIRAAFFIVEPRRAELEEVARLIDGGVRPVVGAEFPLADAVQAYRHKPARGKGRVNGRRRRMTGVTRPMDGGKPVRPELVLRDIHQCGGQAGRSASSWRTTDERGTS